MNRENGISAEQQEAIIAARGRGDSLFKISIAFNCSENTASKICRREYGARARVTQANLAHREEKILAAIQAKPGISRADICTACEMHSNIVSPRLTNLLILGNVRKIGEHGKYRFFPGSWVTPVAFAVMPEDAQEKILPVKRRFRAAGAGEIVGRKFDSPFAQMVCQTLGAQI